MCETKSYELGLFKNEHNKRCYATVEHVKAHQNEFYKLNSNTALDTENSIENPKPPKPPKPRPKPEDLPGKLQRCPKINGFGQITWAKNGKPLYVCYKAKGYIKDVDGEVKGASPSHYGRGLFKCEKAKRCYATVKYVKSHQDEFNELNADVTLNTEHSFGAGYVFIGADLTVEPKVEYLCDERLINQKL